MNETEAMEVKNLLAENQNKYNKLLTEQIAVYKELVETKKDRNEAFVLLIKIMETESFKKIISEDLNQKIETYIFKKREKNEKY